jgi:hypothetical protein
MSVLRFLFGHGWWVLWYLAFYAILLISVVFTLLIFGQELKPRGVGPATPSPASILVFLIGIGLAFVTLANGALYAGLAADWPWYGRAALVVGLPLAVLAIGLPINGRLASDQSHASFWANVTLAVVVTAINLAMLWHVTSPRGR